MLQCPNCKRIIMDVTVDGGYKLRTRMLVFTGGGAFATCPTCKSTVAVPVLLGDTSSFVPKPEIFIKAN